MSSMHDSCEPPILGQRGAQRALLSAPTLAAIALMIVNDHLLKGAGILPGFVTGKLSDFAFLFFAPIVLASMFRARRMAAVMACYAAPVALYVAINVSHVASAYFASAMSRVFPMQLWPDVEDLIALAIVPVSWWYLWRQRPATAWWRGSKARVLVTAIAALSCMATSPARPVMAPTHRAVFMSWEELRGDAVKVMPPQPIEKRGKILIAHDHLFMSEPGKGVHVIDNRDHEHPAAVAFIRIPGNIDIAVRENLLYADSFVDLLTFQLDLERREIKLIGRLENQFEYDPYQTIDGAQTMHVDYVDRSKGVVIRFDPIAAPPPGATP